MPDIALYVNGLKWLGWQEATVTRSIDAVFNQYTLRLTSTWPGAPGAGIPPVKKGDECSLALEGETVVTGFLNNVRLKVTADGFDLTVDGRDKTSTCVDLLKACGRHSNAEGLAAAGAARGRRGVPPALCR